MGGLVAWGRAAVHDMRARLRLQRMRRHAAGPALRGAAETARSWVMWSMHAVTSSYHHVHSGDAFGLRRSMHTW